MNSLSKNHWNDDLKVSRKRHKENEVLLKCSNPSSITLPTGTAVGSVFTVSAVTINASRFSNPCIKLEFTSNIITTAAVLTLNFQIFKLYRNQFTPRPIGPIWTLSRSVATTDANTFTFFICDCDCCSDDCCTYSVVATVAGAPTVGVTAINNSLLSALVVENNCHCC